MLLRHHWVFLWSILNMTPLLTRYPYDPTGSSLNNAVLNDPYKLDYKAARSIAVRYGCFYSKSVIVKDAATQEILKRGVHYSFTCLNAEAVMLTGREIHSMIIITEKTVSDTVLVSYQAVGGQFSSHENAIEQLVQSTSLDAREVFWPNIDDKPSVFPPEKHTHDIGDIYNFNQFVYRTDRIRQALEVKMTLELDTIYLKTDQDAADIKSRADALDVLIQSHINNDENPHQTTAAQIDAYIRQKVDDLFASTHASIDQQLITANNAVITHLNAINPHQDTAANIGSLTSAQMEAAIAAALAANPSGADGVYEYRYGDYTYSWSETNPYTTAVFYSVTSMGTSDRGTAQRIYVNGTLITDGQTLVYRDPKRTQGVVWVPGGGSISVDSNAGGYSCRLLVYRFRPA